MVKNSRIKFREQNAELARAIEARNRDLVQMAKDWRQIVKKYDGKMVAYLDGEVRVAADSLELLLELMDKRSISRKLAHIESVNRESRQCLAG